MKWKSFHVFWATRSKSFVFVNKNNFNSDFSFFLGRLNVLICDGREFHFIEVERKNDLCRKADEMRS